MSLITSVTSYLAALPAQCSKDFFGLPPWYKYLPMEYKDGSCSVAESFQLLGNGANSGLLLIALAIVDMLLRIAGMVAFGFLLYGGFQYLTSQAEPDALNKAKHTIMNALIGLVLAIISTAIVVFVGTRLSA